MILRVVAAMIALAGLADPVISVRRQVRQPLTVTILDTPTLSLPDEHGTRREGAYQSSNTLVSELADDYAGIVREQSVQSTADPCPADGACVVVSDGARPRVMGSHPRILGGVRVGGALSPNIAITAIDAPRNSDVGAIAAFDVQLDARGLGGATTTLQAFDGDVVVGSASYSWPTSKGDDQSQASLRLEWVPLATGTREVRVVASALPNEATLVDNEARTSVEVVARRSNVLVFEPQPSWVSAFVRRALESDGRFNVMVRARLGPAHTMGPTTLPLTAEALEQQDIRTVVVAAPQLLAESEVDALERLVRLRGASLVMLLEAPPTGRISQLLHATGVERREVAPVVLGTLKASELVVLRSKGVQDTVLAAAEKDPVIVSTPLGQGRIIASGAVDAWRYRDDGEFDTFWRSLVADATDAAGDPVALTLSHVIASVGEPVAIGVDWRSVRDMPGSLNAAGVLQCGRHATLIRLWPSARRGRFRGVFDAPAEGDCKVSVAVHPGATAAAPLRVIDKAPGPFDRQDSLSAAVRAHGGTMVAAGGERELITRLRALASRERRSAPLRPMRSPWWMIPFTACLGIEWWLRRRRGLP